MELKQNDFEHIKDLQQRGEITLDQAHVMMVRARRVMLVTGRIPAAVRKALNNAVKSGELCHLKKDGHKPEAYYHPTFEYLVAGERNQHRGGADRGVVRRAPPPGRRSRPGCG